MPYAAPSTVVAGNIYTPTMYNTFLQGNADSGYMRMIADSTAPGAVASFDFTSIPQTFAHLLLVMTARGDTAAASTAVSARFNNDSGSNYSVQQILATGGSSAASEALAQTAGRLGEVPAATAPASSFGSIALEIPHYTGAVGHKAATTRNASREGTGTGTMILQFEAMTWFAAAAAISRITILPGAGNFVTGSRATLYGMPA